MAYALSTFEAASSRAHVCLRAFDTPACQAGHLHLPHLEFQTHKLTLTQAGVGGRELRGSIEGVTATGSFSLTAGGSKQAIGESYQSWVLK